MRTPAKLTLATAALAITLAACGGTAAESDGPDVTSPTTEPTTEVSEPDTGTETEQPSDDTSDAPASDDAPEPVADGERDCSADGITVGDGAFLDLTEQAAATAEFVLDAAVRCDEQLLATAAAESDTLLTYGDADPYEFFGLPDAEEPYYEILARLLGDTQPDAVSNGDNSQIWYWPAVATERGFNDDAAWADLAETGLYTEEELEAFRSDDSGYLGWRIGIDDDGTWMFFVAGD